MKKILLSIFLFSTLLSFAQLNCEGVEYTHSTFNEPYVSLDPESANNLSNGEVWDDPDWTFPLGFDFTFYNLTTSQMMIIGDLLGAGVVANPTTIKSEASVLMPSFSDFSDLAFREDLKDYETGGLSDVSYINVGAPGSQIFKLEWNNVGFYNELSEGTAENFMNFQMWLYEEGSVIEYRFGPSNIVDSMAFDIFDELASPVSALVCSAPFDDGLVQGISLVGDPSNPDLVTIDEENLTAFDSVPVSGQVYRFERTEIVGVEEELTMDLVLSAGPNPFTDKLTVEISQKIEFITVLDLTGKVLWESSEPLKKVTIDTSGFASGIYFVRAESTNGATVTKKVVK